MSNRTFYDGGNSALANMVATSHSDYCTLEVWTIVTEKMSFKFYFIILFKFKWLHMARSYLIGQCISELSV